MGVFSSHLLCGCVHGPLSYCDISVEYEAVASEPTEKWGGVVRRAKGRGLGACPIKILLKSSFFCTEITQF